MDHHAIAAVIQGVAPVIHSEIEGVKAFFAERLADLAGRVGTLEDRPSGPGPAGRDGKDADVELICGSVLERLHLQIEKQIGAAVASLPAPERGEKGDKGDPGELGPAGPPGSDGKDGAEGQQGPIGPQGAPGEPGELGPPGPPGSDGKDGAEGQQGPIGPQGAPGEPGEPGPRGETGVAGLIGPAGPQGESGRDGRDGLPGVQGEKGRDGVDGKDGKDGLGIDDVTEELDDRQLIRRYWRDGQVVKEFCHRTSSMLYRGVWKAQGYQKGDVTTFGGSSWIALVDTHEKPETSHDWQLAVKRGQNGKDGKDGRNGERGAPGRDAKPWEPPSVVAPLGR